MPLAFSRRSVSCAKNSLLFCGDDSAFCVGTAVAEDALILVPDMLLSTEPEAESLMLLDFAADAEALYAVVNLETRKQLYQYAPWAAEPTMERKTLPT